MDTKLKIVAVLSANARFYPSPQNKRSLDTAADRSGEMNCKQQATPSVTAWYNALGEWSLRRKPETSRSAC
eukprot:5909677-Pleurochrysis_carterae.AAC.2